MLLFLDRLVGPFSQSRLEEVLAHVRMPLAMANLNMFDDVFCPTSPSPSPPQTTHTTNPRLPLPTMINESFSSFRHMEFQVSRIGSEQLNELRRGFAKSCPRMTEKGMFEVTSTELEPC